MGAGALFAARTDKPFFSAIKIIKTFGKGIAPRGLVYQAGAVPFKKAAGRYGLVEPGIIESRYSMEHGLPDGFPR